MLTAQKLKSERELVLLREQEQRILAESTNLEPLNIEVPRIKAIPVPEPQPVQPVSYHSRIQSLTEEI